MIKRFLDWMRVKAKCDALKTKPPFFKEGEIWWCYMGENVGHEQNGKGDDFTRPAYIFKKYNNEFFLALPLTSKTQRGSWYFELLFKNKFQTVLLSQGKSSDYRRLKEKIGEINHEQQLDIWNAYFSLHSDKSRPRTVSSAGRGKSQKVL